MAGRGAEPRPPGGGAAGRRRRGGQAATRDRASRTRGAPRCARRAPARSTRARVEHRAVRAGRRPSWRRWSTCAGCGCASRSPRRSRSRRRTGRRSPSASASLGEPGVPRDASTTSATVADAATRQVEILAWVDNPGVLKPGFFAEVTLATETHQRRRSWSRRAPSRRASAGFVVYVVEEGKARERPVQIGLRTGDGCGRDPLRPRGRRDDRHRGLGPARPTACRRGGGAAPAGPAGAAGR